MLQDSMLVGIMLTAVTVLFLAAMRENSAMMMFCFQAESVPADHLGVFACALAVIVLAGSQVVMKFQRPIDRSSHPEPPSSIPEPPAAAYAPPVPTHTGFVRTKRTGKTLHLQDCGHVDSLHDEEKVEMRPCGMCRSLYCRSGETMVKTLIGEWHSLDCKTLFKNGRRRRIYNREHITPCQDCKPLLGQRGVSTTVV